MSALGQQIGDRRRALGMTQQRLGEVVGAQQGQISQYETGYRGLRLRTLLAIAEALDCDVRLVPRDGAR